MNSGSGMLSNFPLVNQLHEPTADGQPDENANWNCVPACISAGLEYLTHQTFDGDELKDAVYGQGYTGAMAAEQFVGYCRDRGVALMPVSGSNATLIAAVHTAVDAGDPVLMTIPSAWDTVTGPTDGPTHVVIACGVAPGSITAMNPWGGFLQTQPDSWWEARLQYGQVWQMEVVGVGVPSGWRDDGKTLVAPNGVQVTLGFRDYILSHLWDAANLPLNLAYGSQSIEPGNPSIGAGTRQDFRWSSLGWTQSRGVYAIWLGQDVVALEAQVASLQKQVADLEAKLGTTSEPGYVEFKAAVEAIKAALAVAS